MLTCIIRLLREAIEEDAHGLLDSAVADIIEKTRRRRLEERRAAGQVRLGIMRHMYIILDFSQAMLDPDLKPNRMIAATKVCMQHKAEIISFHINYSYRLSS